MYVHIYGVVGTTYLKIVAILLVRIIATFVFSVAQEEVTYTSLIFAFEK